MNAITDQERTHYARLLKRRAGARARSAVRRRRLREGRVPVLIEIDEVNVAERFKLAGDPTKQDLQAALQSFIDREINCVTA